VQSVELDALEAQLKELVALVGGLSDAEFGKATRCPGWTVRELVAHCEGMLIRLVGENAEPVDGGAEIDRAGYYGYDPDGPREGSDPTKTFSEVVRDRVVEEAGGRRPEELRRSLEDSIDAVMAGVRAIPADRVIERSGHGRIRFDEFCATRVLEFGVHTMDIGHATLRGERIVPQAVPIVAGILQRRLGAELPRGMGWDDRTFILTGTGRRHLEPNERFALGELASRFPLLR
jgi:uncharacterized protein (TIGR03083 family)